MAWSRTLHFVSDNLTCDATLFLTFDTIEPGVSRDNLPPCLNIIRFPATGPASAAVHYTNDLAFIKPQVNEDDFVSPRTWVRIQPGESTQLKLSSPDTTPKLYEWTAPIKPETEHLMTADNKTDETVDIAFGYILNKYTAKSALVFKDIQPNNQIAVQFKPILRGYIGVNFTESSLIKACEITECLFTQDLSSLNEVSTWVVKRDSEGKFSINLEEMS